MTSKPLVRRTLATLRSAEFGFFGVVVYTRVHAPRFCGEPASAGTFDFGRLATRPWRTNWLTVGIYLRFQKQTGRQRIASVAAPGLKKRPDYKEEIGAVQENPRPEIRSVSVPGRSQTGLGFRPGLCAAAKPRHRRSGRGLGHPAARFPARPPSAPSLRRPGR